MDLTCPTVQSWLSDATKNSPSLRPLPLSVVGLNHQTAPVAVREKAAVRPEREAELLRACLPYAGEAMLLCTCNRTEIYLVGPQDDPQQIFLQVFGPEFAGYLYRYQGQQAVEHLFRVTAGLDSLILGETQIQGQVKRAWQAAHTACTSHTLLNKVAQAALAAGKRVRSETSMSDKVVSVSSAAVELARDTLGDLQGSTTLVIGAGETAELTLTHLREAGAGEVIVVNRTVERAQKLAKKWNGHAHAYEYLQKILPQADVVIASSAAPHYVLHAKNVAKALAQRDRGMLLIDISVPRILDPSISKITEARLCNLDDLTGIVQNNLQSRRAALPQAEAILRSSSAELQRWYLTRQASLLRQQPPHSQMRQHR